MPKINEIQPTTQASVTNGTKKAETKSTIGNIPMTTEDKTEQERLEQLNEKIDLVKIKIQQIKESEAAEHFNERYNFTIDKATGDVIIQLGKRTSLSKIKSDFQIKDGVLLNANKEKIERFMGAMCGDTSHMSYDNCSAPKDETLVIPNDAFNPKLDERSFLEKLKYHIN